MDVLSGLLDGPRARDAFLLRAVLDPPWSIRVCDETPLSLVTVSRGHVHLAPDHGKSLRLGPGDVAVVRGTDHYTYADHPGSAPQVVIHPDQRCTSVDGTELFSIAEDWGDKAVRTWGNAVTGSTMLLIGSYRLDGEISRRVLDALPTVLMLTADEWNSPLTTVLGNEIGRDLPGQQTILDRLLDLMLITVLRTWFDRGDAPAWYAARHDAVVGKALALIHDAPHRPWTVTALARETGVSRAGFAARFTELVGEPPMTYLTSWRLGLAADLLRDTDATIGAVAGKVGYGSPYALSSAFKRVLGVTPAQYRRAKEPVTTTRV